MSNDILTRISRCARCGKSIRATAENPWRPFCSERCKTIDLGDWFTERYRVPGSESPENPQSPAEPED